MGPCVARESGGLSARRGPTLKRHAIRNERCSVSNAFCPPARFSKATSLSLPLPHAHYHHLKNHHSSLRSWLGQRWAGHEGTAQALRTIEEVQMDPLNVVARSHDIVLWSRVSGY